MSKEQWGHGFHSGRTSANAKKKSGYVDLWFFTTDEDGRIKHQGQIRRRVDKTHWAVQHHEWVMGEPNGSLVVVSDEELAKFHLFEDATALRRGIHDYQLSRADLYPDYSSEGFELWEEMLQRASVPRKRLRLKRLNSVKRNPDEHPATDR